MRDNPLAGLLLVFVPLSLLSIGGGPSILAGIQNAVEARAWMSQRDFLDLFAIARAAPGPSTLIVALIGWQVAGFLGALAATLAIFVPSSIVMFAASSWWLRNEHSAIRKAIEQGLAPVAVGLIFAGMVIVLRAAHAGLLALATTGAVCILQSTTKISTYATVGAVAGIYLILFALLRYVA